MLIIYDIMPRLYGPSSCIWLCQVPQKYILPIFPPCVPQVNMIHGFTIHSIPDFHIKFVSKQAKNTKNWTWNVTSKARVKREHTRTHIHERYWRIQYRHNTSTSSFDELYVRCSYEELSVFGGFPVCCLCKNPWNYIQL